MPNTYQAVAGAARNVPAARVLLYAREPDTRMASADGAVRAVGAQVSGSVLLRVALVPLVPAG
jgi:hypothetical protein